ncbi:MAG: protein translocase subunit SecD [Candidatus Paceibacterota bacterium]
MSNKQTAIFFILIIILAVVAGLFSYPAPYNQLVDRANAQFNSKIPHWQVPDFKLGLDLKGGVHLEYKADLSKIPEGEKKTVMDGLRDLLERRVNSFGVSEPVVQVYGADRVSVDLPGFESIENAIAYIGETPLLEFWEERSQAEIDQINAKKTEINNVIKQNQGKTQEEISAEIEKITDWQLALQIPYKATELTGRYLQKSTLSFDPTTNAPIVELQFNDEGAKIFEDVTGRNVGKTIAIFLDGQSIIDTDGDNKITSDDLYAPRVEQQIIGGKAVITGIKDVNEARTIVQRLNQGALPVPLGNPIVQQKIGPTLGAISLDNAVKAGEWGMLLIIIFLILFYRLPGLLASLALVIYAVVLFALLKLFSATLTLAGIGGLILSIGMAVDANVLIFSRLREELRSGKDLLISIKEAIRRAWPSIRDGNFTTIIVALILYFLGTSFIKAFAFALILGILLSMFSAVVITNVFLELFGRSKIGRLKWLWS